MKSTRKARLRLQDAAPSELVERFLNELLSDAKRSRDRSFDPRILRSDGLGYAVSSEAFRLARRIATAQRASSPEHVASFSARNYERLSMNALGDTISDLKRQANKTNDPNTTFETEDILRVFQTELKRQLATASLDLFRHVPCHIFHATKKISDFEIGPVHFRCRRAWADHYIACKTVRDEVKRAWRGGSEKGAQLEGRDKLQVEQILRTIGQHEWVGSVFVQRHDFDNSHSMANIVVGLALDSLGLFLESQDAELLNRAEVPFYRGGARIATTTEGKIFGGSTARLPGLGGTPEMADDLVAQTETFREAVGRILSLYTGAHHTGADAPLLVERWVNALHWFGEARRAPSDFMAVVKYGCALDILTGAGGNLTSMARYVQSALGITEATDQDGNSLPLRDLINNMFNEGRSALAHGETFGLLADRMLDRIRADAIVRRVLVVVTEPLSSIIKENDRMLTVNKSAQGRAFETRLQAMSAQRQ